MFWLLETTESGRTAMQPLWQGYLHPSKKEEAPQPEILPKFALYSFRVQVAFRSPTEPPQFY